MEETLTQRRRVGDEGLRVVKPCRRGRKACRLTSGALLTVPSKEAPANSVPAAAVRRRVQALFGLTGRKGRVGGLPSLV
jgi:hypothetical protein